MPSQKNLNQVKLITQKLEKAKTVVLADYSGLSVDLQQDLRQKVIEAGGELMVAKNTLIKIAVKNLKYPLEDLTDSFIGPTIALFCYQDPIAPLKALAQFADNHQLPQIKAGFLQKEPLTKNQVKQLAKLPSKVELIQKTVNTIKAPLTGFVNVLSGNLQNLVYALKAIRQQADSKGGESNGR